jgi:uncharacterized membrane protein HdeD (DUF308 family)
VRFVRGFARFWWDFVVGDDWRIAAGVVTVLAGGAVLVARTSVPDGVVAAVTAVGIVVVAIGTIAAAGRDNA